MAKVFTITEGLENLGALKTGGQGSVYKGRRMGEIISAIKILPTPIYSESETDKNFISFSNEVQKLKKVNESPNPNVVSILNSGITDSGNFPFIEMEYIEGPDLGELLKDPHESVFTIKETIRVAEQLSNALAHCHRVDVKHGDIKSNNVKFNTKTGNYILLDFGLSVMSDEQRRTSLRHAGAIEFMAPEQNNAQMFFQTDVYSFGVIVYELLAGVVPFPLNDNSEITRNTIMVSHMETAPPDLMALREKNLPENWSQDKKAHEMQVPGWLISMVYKCLEKKPEDRYINGMDLNEQVIRNSISTAAKSESSFGRVNQLQEENAKLIREASELKAQLAKFKNQSSENSGVPAEPFQHQIINYPKNPGAQASKNWLIGLLTVAILGVIAYILFNTKTGMDTISSKTDTSHLLQQISNGTTSYATVPASATNKDVSTLLLEAKRDVASNNIERALIIYERLAKQEVPEAMYYYGNFALQNSNQKINCDEALDYLNRARNKNYAPAKATLGFIYSFADDPAALQERGYGKCSVIQDLKKGSNLLMQAMLQGDTMASGMLDELNIKNQNSIIKDTTRSEY